jgi:fluoride ion exporter CrcB/FEX
MGFLIVFLGGGVGAALRHGINLLAARYAGTGFPYGTLVINVLGSLAMGLIAEYFALKAGLPAFSAASRRSRPSRWKLCFSMSAAKSPARRST